MINNVSPTETSRVGGSRSRSNASRSQTMAVGCSKVHISDRLRPSCRWLVDRAERAPQPAYWRAGFAKETTLPALTQNRAGWWRAYLSSDRVYFECLAARSKAFLARIWQCSRYSEISSAVSCSIPMNLFCAAELRMSSSNFA